MAGITFGRRKGRWFIQSSGCCVSGDVRAEYDRAHAVQELRAGGRLTEWSAERFTIADRKGRLHRYPA